MAFEENKFNVVRKKQLDKTSFSVECNVDTTEEIEKILSISHVACVDNIEVLNGQVSCAGTIDLGVVFQTANGEIGVANSACPFTSKLENEDVKVGDIARIGVEITDCQIENVSNGNIKIFCRLEQTTEVVQNREIVAVGATGEDICSKMTEIKIDTFVGQNSEKFDVESEFLIKEPIKRVVFVDSKVALKGVESGANFVSVYGQTMTKVLYLTQNDRFETGFVVEDFKQEIELDGANRECVCQADVCIKRNLIKAELEDMEKGVKVKLTIPVEAKVYAFEQRQEQIVSDLYSTKNEVKISTESFEMTRVQKGEEFEAKIDGVLTLDDDKPRIDKLMFVGATNLYLTNSYIKGGEAYVEGITKTNVIYLNDETNSFYSVLMEVPFVVSDKVPFDCENEDVNASATIYDVDVSAKKGRELYFDAKLKVFVEGNCNEVEAVISDVELGVAFPEKDYGMEVLFGRKGQNSWDIAKDVNIREETLTDQNPETIFPLEEDENLIVFYQKKA